MTTSSLNGKPDDYESRKAWTNKDWYTHVGAWENDQGRLCFGSTMAFSAMMQQFHRTHVLDLLNALERIARPHDCGCVPCTGSCTSQEALQITVDEMRDLAKAAIARSA